MLTMRDKTQQQPKEKIQSRQSSKEATLEPIKVGFGGLATKESLLDRFPNDTAAAAYREETSESFVRANKTRALGAAAVPFVLIDNQPHIVCLQFKIMGVKPALAFGVNGALDGKNALSAASLEKLEEFFYTDKVDLAEAHTAVCELLVLDDGKPDYKRTLFFYQKTMRPQEAKAWIEQLDEIAKALYPKFAELLACLLAADSEKLIAVCKDLGDFTVKLGTKHPEFATHLTEEVHNLKFKDGPAAIKKIKEINKLSEEEKKRANPTAIAVAALGETVGKHTQFSGARLMPLAELEYWARQVLRDIVTNNQAEDSQLQFAVPKDGKAVFTLKFPDQKETIDKIAFFDVVAIMETLNPGWYLSNVRSCQEPKATLSRP